MGLTAHTNLLQANTQSNLNAPIQNIKPLPLQKGDTIGIVAPGFTLPKPELVRNFAKMLEEEGYSVIFGTHTFGKHGYFSGTDAQRAGDLNAMFANKEVKGIVAARGGWGCARILSLLDYDAIKADPKVFIGYSDITSLLLGIYQKTGLVTFHGPVGTSDWNRFSYKHYKKVIIKEKSYKIRGTKKVKSDATIEDAETARYVINEGKATGTLVGGNLTVLCGMIGSEYLPDFEGKILFIEDVGEAVYRIDRYLTHLKLAGILDKISGLVFASCASCEEEEDRNDNFTLREILQFHLEPLGIPAFFGLLSGHLKEQYTLPLGVQVEINAKKGNIKLLEEAVKA
jgi:muramoyltetrapeptide carboxypeptidase